MNHAHILSKRLINQQLLGTNFSHPEALVHHLGAVQAQDYAMAKWAIGLRLSISESIVDAAIHQGDIIRTHILRPTWHFVSPKDIRWMLALTAPFIKKQNAVLCRYYELDDAILAKCNSLIEKMLAGNQHFTREEIALELSRNGIPSHEMRAATIMMNAELDALVCNGIMKGKQFTYALLEERVPASPAISQEEALATLAKKYFSSHGAASLHDFAWWSGLPISLAKRGIEQIASELETFQIASTHYWHYPTAAIQATESLHFLPAFDEFLISYKDRTAAISIENQPAAFTKNGIFYPIILLNGKVIAVWKREIKKDSVKIDIQAFEPIDEALNQRLFEAAQQYADFLGKNLMITK